MEMQLKLHIDDYLTAIAGVALMRLQKWAEANLAEWRDVRLEERPIRMKADHVEVDSSVLDHLPRWYFLYLMDKHSVRRREQQRLKSLLTSGYQSSKDKLSRLKDSINNNFKKLSKYFPDSPKITAMQHLLVEIKSIKSDPPDEQMESIVERYLDLLADEQFEERLTLNVIRSFLFNNFFGQTSMLQLTRSSLNLQGHIEYMQRDFVEPVKLDIAIRQWLDTCPEPTADSKKALVDLLSLSKSDRHPYKSWSNEIKKLKPEEIHAYMNGKLRCSFEEEWLATIHFEEMTFAPLGISGALVNFNWEHAHHQMPISNWIRLLLFMAPAGLTSFTRYKQMPFTNFNKDEYETFYCFVYRDGTPEMICGDNNALDDMEHNESFDRLIPKLIERETYKAKRRLQPNIQILEFQSDINMKKTVLHDYHVPRHVLIYFSSEKSNLQYMQRPIREAFLKLILESIDPISVIWNYLRSVIQGKGSPYSAYLAIRERWLIEQLKKEGLREMDEALQKKAGYIRYISKEGAKIRRGLDRRADKQSESTDYVSSGSKRAAGVAYRLLNAARSGDKQLFLDTTIRLYLSVGEEVPISLLNVLHEEKVDFATWSGAFITGLLGGDQKEPSDEQTEDSENVQSNGG